MGIFSNLIKKKKKAITITKVFPIFEGKIKSLADVSHYNYDYHSLGEGFAIEFSNSLQYIIIKAPISGVLDLIFPSLNSYVLKTKEDVKVLVSLGIESLSLPEAFEALVEEGKEVREGDALVKVDLNKLRDKGINTDAIVLVLPESNATQVEYDDFMAGAIVDPKQAIISIYK